MTDYDADEIVPQRKRGERTPLIDKALGATGVALAAIATFFSLVCLPAPGQILDADALAGQYPRHSRP